MLSDEFSRLLRSVVTLAHLLAQKPLGSSEQRPAPAIFLAMTVAGIDEIFGDDAALHLQAGDVGVEAAAHLPSHEPAQGTQFASDKAAMLL